YHAVVVRSATKVRQVAIDAAAEAGNLKVIVRGGVGIDNIDHAYAKEKGIETRNTPAASSVSVAELAFGMMLACARHIGWGTHTMKNGQWLKKELKGVELFGKTLGIIGYGRIGREVAKRAEAFGMNVVGHDMYFNCCPVTGKDLCDVDVLIPQCDFITLHIPFDPACGPSLGAPQFKMMKKGVIIVNCARGGTIDEKALLEALNDGTVYAAGLDVFEKEPPEFKELIDHPRVVTTPHIGASTVEAQNKVGDEVVKVLREFFNV
ncbi:MAG TPA: 3-phosphoglycerate dehydrogenase, partial [Firmicutes bacterium]|nr:3-phosphoglycerate dehydrogenase [Bacillota bacterium]